MIVKILPKEAQEKGIWQKLCDLLGIDVFALSEGTFDLYREIELTEEQARELGLLQRNVTTVE